MNYFATEATEATEATKATEATEERPGSCSHALRGNVYPGKRDLCMDSHGDRGNQNICFFMFSHRESTLKFLTSAPSVSSVARSKTIVEVDINPPDLYIFLIILINDAGSVA
jgi:hypothetical protein